MSYIFRLTISTLVASSIIFSGCLSKNTQSKNDDNWKAVYKNAYTNHDYVTATVALNHLIISEKDSLPDYYDSLAFYYIKRLKNFDAGEKMVDKGLTLNPNNVMLLEFKALLLGSSEQIDAAITNLDKLIKLSPKLKYIYYKASLEFSKSNDINEYFNVINTILYDPNIKSEMVEVNVDQNTTQEVDIRSSMYMDKAKVAVQSQKFKETLNYVDSALRLSPNYQEALMYREKLTNPQGR
jgi:tetratricopeptide (TPR) repeat protein